VTSAHRTEALVEASRSISPRNDADDLDIETDAGAEKWAVESRAEPVGGGDEATSRDASRDEERSEGALESRLGDLRSAEPAHGSKRPWR